MALTPVELRHARFGRSLLGYRRREVDRLLADTVASFEDVWRSRADLADKVDWSAEPCERRLQVLRTALAG